jgi:hypothetical protein
MPNVGVYPYDVAGYILEQAIIITGDTAGPAGLGGNILNPNQPGIIPMLGRLYRELQDRLISASVETFNKYGYINGIPPASTSNPSSQVFLNYIGYFDGNEMQASWKLPPDLLKPLEVWERQSGNNFWVPLVPVSDSISTRPIMPFYNNWDYQNDTLYLPPANQTNDLKLKYLCYAPDITTVSSPVLIPRCQSALAYRMAAEVAKQRGGLEMAAVWSKDAETAEAEIINRTARRESYQAFFRIPFRRRRSGRGRAGN